jgi:hypothetical protein
MITEEKMGKYELRKKFQKEMNLDWFKDNVECHCSTQVKSFPRLQYVEWLENQILNLTKEKT